MNTSQSAPPGAAKRGGFTLVELMVVIVILGLLATAVGLRVIDHLAKARWSRVQADLHTIDSAIEIYVVFNKGQHPETLEALILPDEHGKKLLNRDVLPKDPWGNEYAYEPPIGTESYRVICYGADGVPGGDPNSDDRDYDTDLLRNE